MASFGQSLQICFLQRNDRTSGLHRALLTNRQYLAIRFDLIEIIDAVCIVLCPFDDNDDSPTSSLVNPLIKFKSGGITMKPTRYTTE